MVSTTLVSQLTAFREVCRLHLCGIATQQRRPMSQGELTVIATPVSPTGFMYATEVRSRADFTLYRDYFSSPHPQLTGANLPHASIAQLILDAYGEQCDAFDANQATPFQASPLVWIANVLLWRALHLYLGSLSSLDQPDLSRATRAATDLLDFIESDSVTDVISLPVAGLQTDTSCSDSDLVLRPLTNDERGQLWQAHGPTFMWTATRHFSSTYTVNESALLEVRVRRHKREQPTAAPGTRLNKVLIAFELLGFSPAGNGNAATFVEPQIAGDPGSWHGSGVQLRRCGPERSCDNGTLGQVGTLATKLAHHDVPTTASAAHLSVHRFHLGALEEQPSEALLDFVIALEALLLHEDSQDPKFKGELRFRFSLNGALFLSDSYEERKKLFVAFRSLYDVRSALVHGGLPPSNVSEADATSARDLTSRCVRKAMNDHWPSAAEFKDLWLR